MSFDIDLQERFICNNCKHKFFVYKDDIGKESHCPECKSRDIEFTRTKIEPYGNKH